MNRKLTAVLQSQSHQNEDGVRSVFSALYNTIIFLFVLATEFVPPQGGSLHANTMRIYPKKGN